MEIDLKDQQQVPLSVSAGFEPQPAGDGLYLLMVEGRETPRNLHRDLSDARAEAERLCRKENKKVYLFRVMDEVAPVCSPVIWKSHVKI